MCWGVGAATMAATLTLIGGCAHQYSYVPVGPQPGGGPAAPYPVPPEAPQGEVYVTSFGFTDMDLGPNQPGTMLHTRLAVSNGSGQAWNVDSRQQMLVGPGLPAQGPAMANTDATGAGPIYQVPPGRASVFDLYFVLPAPLNQAQNLGGFALDWNVDAGGRAVAEQTAFQRYEGAPASYAAYPPYVVVGLGFGVGWWYGPFFPFRFRHAPWIRGYYYGPGRVRGGAWRGPPPAVWRGAPPRARWRGTPPSSGGGAPHGGAFRGHPH